MLYFAHVNILHAYVKKMGVTNCSKVKNHMLISLRHLSQHPHEFSDISVNFMLIAEFNIGNTPVFRNRSASFIIIAEVNLANTQCLETNLHTV